MGQRLGILMFLFLLAGGALILSSSVGEPGGDEPFSPDSPSVMQERVKVQVLNGSGVAGVAWDATQVLRDRGFDVVLYGNAGTYSSDSSVVIDRVGRLGTAGLVAEALGIARVESEPDSSLFVDSTVRLGPDWTSPEILEQADLKPLPWWDLRRFLRGNDAQHSDNPNGP